MSSIQGPSIQQITQAQQQFAQANPIKSAYDSYQDSLIQSAIQGMPPGFITGFTILLNPDSSVTVGAGIASVANIKVEFDTATPLTGRMETFFRTAAMWVYIYLGREGLFHVDTIMPKWFGKYGDFYHTTLPWRYLGRMWIDATGVTRFAGQGGFTYG